MAAKIRWLSVREVYAFHDLALSEDGGMPGLRDAGLPSGENAFLWNTGLISSYKN
jgi:hypothetical protein